MLNHICLLQLVPLHMPAKGQLSNVLAIDYRGFGDSTGTPSEEGLIEDAQTAWDYVTNTASEYAAKGGNLADGVVLMGHSLGTGVASGLAKDLAGRGLSILRFADRLQLIAFRY